jgi:hypothetical protein
MLPKLGIMLNRSERRTSPMTHSKAIVWIGAAACIGLIALGAGREDEKKNAEIVSPPRPGPEHELLKMQEGVWDATIEVKATPDSAPAASRGIETNTLSCGGLWLVSDFKGQLGPVPFQGHGVTGYDPLKKKYVGTWVDSMSSHIAPLEGTHDKDAKTVTFSSEMRDPTGKVEKWKSVTELKDKDTRVWTAHFKDPVTGKEYPALKITYKRRK